MLVECIVNELSSLPDGNNIENEFGDKLILGTNLFGFAEVEYPHDIVWVRSEGRNSPIDSGDVSYASVSIFVRSYNLGKALNTCREIASYFTGVQLRCGDFDVLFKAISIEPSIWLLDEAERYTCQVEFYVEFR